MRIFANAKFRFLENRRKAYILSGIVISIGIVGAIVNLFAIGSWVRYGVDFTGGTLIQVRTEAGVTEADLRNALGGADAPPISRFGAENEFVIRTPSQEEVEVAEVVEPIRARLAADPRVGPFEIVRMEFVGPKIGAELNERAGVAIVLSMALILVYLAFRFEMRFGWAAVIATLHDILFVLSAIVLFRLEVSLTTVAAMLTIIGYSLNDKIVIFDRVRENLNQKGGRREDPLTLVNRSVNETLPRTVLTGGATIAVLVALMLLGGLVIRDFAMILLLGIVVGTYSSMFIGAPALLELQSRWAVKEEAKRKSETKRPGGKSAIPV